MEQKTQESLKTYLGSLLSDPELLDDPELSNCRDIYGQVLDMATYGGMSQALLSMCETEKVYPERIYPCYQDISEILLENPEEVLPHITRYRLLCLWRINQLTESQS
jgi:hypothetical protein